ncbi:MULTISPECIES: hypothetical protein [Cysteiniphilum]|uniref:Uncharacterized protein n=1 Tax=Cysteiniphilum litorale TaxID=2056700 RepID=A0A8J2Z2Z9_9GAMM|nr:MULTISPECIES: hypothetical protein [Cysteiniphilum]GGF91878.1 hypothetical protein GCM10010995_06300 [Cysteiniphilum litorale]
MRFSEPKSKVGKSMLGVDIGYYANNRNTSRWFLNGESAPLPKIAELLGYSSVSQFKLAMQQYGVALVLSKGLDKLRESNNG